MGEALELPRQPVPDLKATLERYLDAVRPVVSSSNHEKCRQIVQEFGRAGGVGQKLQEALVKLAETEENWATPFWLDDMYLNIRLPLPVNSSPFFLFPKQQFHSSSDQLRFAAKTVLFALEYKRRIDENEIAIEMVPCGKGKQQPLCMKTYQNFFSAYRRPADEKDEQVMSQQQTEGHPLHIVVASKNQFYSVEVKSVAGENISENQLVDQLRTVTQMAKEKSNSPPVGILTTENRTTWAKLRNRLLKKNVNGQSFQILENCLFLLCLDDGAPDVPSYSTIRKESTALELTAFAGHLLHGSGSPNRWYDKFLQVIVTRGGVAGVLVEHSASEGITVIKFCEEFLQHLHASEGNTEAPQETNKVRNFAPPPLPLHWDIDDETAIAIQEASKKMNKLYKDVDLFVHRFHKYGKNFIKSQCISPDAFIQIALQLTYYKVHRRLVSTYESASLRRFHLGRVDNIRAATKEALVWVKAMCDDQQVAEETKVRLFQDCIKKQTEIMKYTVFGLGPDNHLLALRELAKSTVSETPDIFQDSCYQEFLNFRLSTSQLPTPHGIIIGYGPVVPDGYGCCYNPCPDHIDFCISSFFSSKETSSDFWAHSLEGSLLHMRELCLKLRQMEEEEAKAAKAT